MLRPSKNFEDSPVLLCTWIDIVPRFVPFPAFGILNISSIRPWVILHQQCKITLHNLCREDLPHEFDNLKDVNFTFTSKPFQNYSQPQEDPSATHTTWTMNADRTRNSEQLTSFMNLRYFYIPATSISLAKSGNPEFGIDDFLPVLLNR